MDTTLLCSAVNNPVHIRGFSSVCCRTVDASTAYDTLGLGVVEERATRASTAVGRLRRRYEEKNLGRGSPFSRGGGRREDTCG